MDNRQEDLFDFADKEMLSPGSALIKQAELLVDATRFLAADSYAAISGQLQIMSKVDQKKWDFFVPIAGIFIAASSLTKVRSDDAQEEFLMEIVQKKTEEWHPDAILAFDNCKYRFEQLYDFMTELPMYQKDKQFLSPDALGFWIFLKLFDRKAEDYIEIMFARLIGSIVIHTFHGWWDEKRECKRVYEMLQ